MPNFLWDSIKSVADKVGEVTAAASYKTKVHTELMLIDRELKGRQQTFGVELYEYVEKLSKEPSFYASDDLLTSTLRPPLLKAQREIAALHNKKVKQKTNLETAKANRAAVAGGTTWQEKVVSTAKTTAMAGGEVKLHTELTLMENEMTHYKYLFGEQLYVEFERLEDEKGWLPTDREIRSIYDQARRDIEKIQKKRVAKEEELSGIGGAAAAPAGGFDPPAVPETPYPNQSAAQPYAAEKAEPAPASFQDSSTPTAYATPAAAATANAAFGGVTPATSYGTPAAATPSYGAPVAPAAPSYGAPAAAAPSPYASSAQGYGSSGYSKPMGYSAPKAAAAPPAANSNWMNQPDPFATSQTAAAATTAASMNSFTQQPQQQQQQQQQVPYDPFASAPQPTLQTQGTTAQPNLFAASPAPASTATTPAASMYDDPFAGLSNFQ